MMRMVAERDCSPAQNIISTAAMHSRLPLWVRLSHRASWPPRRNLLRLRTRARRGAALDGRPYHPATGAPQRPDATADGVGACTGPIADYRIEKKPLQI